MVLHMGSRNKNMNNVTMYVILAIMVGLAIAGIAGNLEAMEHCSLKDTLFFGGKLFWAWKAGYCG